MKHNKISEEDDVKILAVCEKITLLLDQEKCSIQLGIVALAHILSTVCKVQKINDKEFKSLLQEILDDYCQYDLSVE